MGGSAWLRDRAIEWATSDPLGWLGGLVVKLSDVFNGVEVPRNLDPYGDLGRTPLTAAMLWNHGLAFPFGVVLPLAVIGLAVLWRGGDERARAARTLAILAGLNAVGIALFFPSGRYRLGLALSLLPPATAGVVAIGRWVRERVPVGRAALGLGVAALVAANTVPHFTGPDMGAEGPFQQALAYESAKRHGDAVKVMEEEVARRPDDADGWRLLGQARDAMGDNEGAITALRRTVALAPEFAHAWQHLGALLAATNRPAEGAEALQRAVALNPAHPLAWVDLAGARIDLRDYPGAVTAAREAVRVNPDHPMAWLYLGHALVKSGDPAGAEPALRQALVLMPTDPRPRFQLALSLSQRGRKGEAIALLREVLARWPGHKAAARLLDKLTEKEGQ